MTSGENPLDFVGREPDGRLLAEDLDQLPQVVGRPRPLTESPAHRRVVRIGATMTGVTLIGGSGLIVLGIVELIASPQVLWALVLVIGIILVATHWGWVHVAELTGTALGARSEAPVIERRQAWLSGVEPYTRWEVSTEVEEDGSITILTTRCRPVVQGERTFTFVREEVARELHSPDEPSAAVTERAELLRRQAAADTERSRGDFEAARGAYQEALMVRDDEQQRRAALRAASEALSERINAHLRDPPLTE